MRLAALVIVVVGCSGGKSPTFDQAVERFVTAFCDTKNICRENTQPSCAFLLEGKLRDAEPNLDATGQAQCARCLSVRTNQIPALVTNGCAPTLALRQELLAACDIDGTFDWNGDGDPTDDDTEACAGAP